VPENASSFDEKWFFENTHKKHYSARRESVGIPDGKTKRILKLITDGENLNPLNLEAVYRWINDSYEALGFDPLQQQRFDEYSRSSFDSFSIRIDLGVRILKLALGAILSDSRDHSNHFKSSESVLRPGKSRSRCLRKR
jgi:hypothetical protein